VVCSTSLLNKQTTDYIYSRLSDIDLPIKGVHLYPKKSAVRHPTIFFSVFFWVLFKKDPVIKTGSPCSLPTRFRRGPPVHPSTVIERESFRDQSVKRHLAFTEQSGAVSAKRVPVASIHAAADQKTDLGLPAALARLALEASVVLGIVTALTQPTSRGRRGRPALLANFGVCRETWHVQQSTQPKSQNPIFGIN